MKIIFKRVFGLPSLLLILSLAAFLSLTGAKATTAEIKATTAEIKATTAEMNKLPYLIKVNRVHNTITVYEADETGKYTVPVRAMVCSVGRSNRTILGTFQTKAKYRWKELMGNVYGQYSTRIVGGILFHSVYYYRNGNPATLATGEYNKLGTAASHGCIRLTVEDAKWIYDNCAVGTTVVIYDDKQEIGPLGKPEAIKLPKTVRWDPTDPSNENPYKDKLPVITGAKSMTIKQGDELNLLAGIKAKSSVGLDITSKLEVEGTVDTVKPGKYKITYKITDLLGRAAEKKITITVESKDKMDTNVDDSNLEDANNKTKEAKDTTKVDSKRKEDTDNPKANDGIPSNKDGKPEEDADNPKANDSLPSSKDGKPEEDADNPKANDSIPSSKDGKSEEDADNPKANDSLPSSKDGKSEENTDNPKANDSLPSSKDGKSEENTDNPKTNNSIPSNKAGKPEDNSNYTKDDHSTKEQTQDSIKPGEINEEGSQPIGIPKDYSNARLTGVRNRYIREGMIPDKAFVLNGVVAFCNGKSLDQTSITVTITQMSNTLYNVTYKVMFSEISETSTIFVDREAPRFIGVFGRMMKPGEAISRELALTGVIISDNYKNMSLDDISVNIKKLPDGDYLVTYEAQDDAGNVAKAQALFYD